MARVRRRMVWRHALPWLLRGISAGIVAAGIVLLVAHVVAWDGAVWWALGLGLALALAGAAVAWLRRPSQQAAVRRADHLLGLRDRLTTAWEYAGHGPRRKGETAAGTGIASAPALVELQRADLMAHAARADLRRGIAVRPRRLDALAPAVGTLLLVAALVLPTGQAPAQTSRAATHARIAHATNSIAAARRASGQLPPSTLAALPKADRVRRTEVARILSKLQHQLAAAHSPASALKAIARAQDALNRLNNPHAAAQRAALSGLAASLRNAASASALSKALRSGNPAAISAAAKKLASSVSHMSPSARAKLAQALQNAAHATASNAALSQSLQNAATSLAQGDNAGASSALQQAGNQAASAAASDAQQSQLDAAKASLDNARNEVSGLTNNNGSSSSSSQSSSGKNAGQGQSGAGSQGQGNASKGQNGQSGSGKGNGQSGKGAGQGAGSGKGQGQSGKNGSGQSGSGQGSQGSKGQGSGQGGKGQGQSGNGSGKGQGQGGSGKGAGQGQGNGNGNGSGSGKGNGSGQGQGQGNGGAGSGQGSGSPGSGTGGGGQGGNGNSGNNGGSGSRVYVPGSTGKGASQTTTGSKGQPTGGSLQPWRSVLPQYESGARASIENGSVPPDQRALVKKYFDQLSH